MNLDLSCADRLEISRTTRCYLGAAPLNPDTPRLVPALLDRLPTELLSLVSDAMSASVWSGST